MGNCLVTKLKGNVQNPGLSKLGEFRFNVSSLSTIYIDVIPGTNVTVYTLDGENHMSIEGGAGFNTMVIDTGKYIDFENGNYDVAISNKYNLMTFIAALYKSDMNADGLAYCDGLSTLKLGQFDVTHDYSAITLSQINRNVKILELYTNSQIESSVFSQNSFSDFRVAAPINGDVANIHLSEYDGSSMYAINNFLYGSIEHIININCPSISLAVLDFSSHSNDVVTGDISKASGSLKTLNLSNKPNNCSWKTTRSSSDPAISLNSVNLGEDVDAMLINQANCDLTHPHSEWDKFISVTGTRTSASDAAVATIKAAGWTVTVNGETL